MTEQTKLFTHRLAQRVTGVAPSVTVGLADIVAQLKSDGEDVIGLNEGELDFETSHTVTNGTIAALTQGKTRYSWLNGEPLLKELICEKIATDNGIKASAEDVLVTNGSKQVIYEIFQALIEPGDEVIIPVPCWASYLEGVKLAGGKAVLVDNNGPDLDVENIGQAINERTKLIIINTPNNPTGAVYSKAALQAFLKLVKDKSVFVLSDEAYEKIVFDGEHHSLAALDDNEYIITVQSFSKGYSMTGYRLGYMVAHPELVEMVSNLHCHMTDNVCTFAQYGGVSALQMPQSLYQERLEILKQRRDAAYEYAKQIFDCTLPAGAFYLFPNVERYLGGRFNDANQLCEYLLKEAKVALIPAEACLYTGHIRIAYAASMSDIEKAFERLDSALKTVNKW